MKECSGALDLFLNNRFMDALALLKPRRNQSMYHAMGYSSILVMQAGMTFEPKDMDAAMSSLGESLQTCQKFRKKVGIIESLSNFFYRQQAERLTEEEMHAELCYAEVLLQKAALTFLDESIIGFIKGGMRIRNSYQIYKVLRLMEFLGFSGDRASVNSLFTSFGSGEFSSRCHFSLGIGDGDLKEAEALLAPYKNKFPNGALILFYTARIAVLKGNFTFAQEKYLACIASQEEWRQIHHLCYWELMWAYSFEQNWREAYHYANLLSKESKWSQAVYVFQKAAILSMLPEEEVTELGENVVQLFRQVEGLRLKIAGKSIPTEKFAAKKAQRYVSSVPGKLVVPALEMMYVWNGFTVVGKRPELTENILSTLEKTEDQLRNETHPSEYHQDDECLVQLLKGLCLRELGRLVQAEICFNRVISRWSHLTAPHHTLELTACFFAMQNCFFVCRMNYKDYSMESRLHFRIHAALNTMGSFAAKLPPSRTPA
uniref:Tetratricopeptide repeat protein 39B n=1 Tax=Gouania willdenowi TaxID=441366 RepID=A0A8C5GAU8_GOUWI